MKVITALLTVLLLHTSVSVGLIWITNMFLPKDVEIPTTYYTVIAMLGLTLTPYVIAIATSIFCVITDPKIGQSNDEK